MTLRFKMTTIVVAVLLVANSLLSFTTLRYVGSVWLGEVQTRVKRNLNSARSAYDRRTELVAVFLEGAARDRRLLGTNSDNGDPSLGALLAELQADGHIDFVTLLDPDGAVICRAQGSGHGDSVAHDPVVSKAIAKRETATGTIILSHERLLAEGEDLAERASFVLVQTPAARHTTDRVRNEGMVIAAVVPVRDMEGHVRAFLYGGNLLNHSYELVDAIKSEVFPDETYRGRDIGTVTIFQGDLRISTNVTMQDGSRAVGTRLSETVCQAVLDQGGVWTAPAFVVNDWYITAYEPILDPNKEIIGVLYVGVLRAPFVHQLNIVTLVFLAIVLGTTVASLILLFIATSWVLRPVHHVVVMAQRVIGGDLTARVGIRPPGEMGVLCRAIDSMAEAVAEREEMITSDAQRQIGRSEQLASVGRLAAGVAHEINNPLTGVLAFADMLRDKENMDDEDRQDLDLIIRETKRVREIVRGLLDFARETPFVKKPIDINDLIRQTLRLLGRRGAFQNVYTVEDLDEELPAISADRNQLQQVLMNLVLNACEAMADGGTLMVASSRRDERVVVKVTDTGCGINPEQINQIFEPFYTSKPVGKGTGLGLSVSYGILQQHGGTLEVESVPNMGSTFTITLPIEPAAPAGDERQVSEAK